MIRQFDGLTESDRGLLFKAPVIISVLASCVFGEVNEVRKSDAIQLAHLKTFTATPSLLAYYAEVEKSFKAQFEFSLKAYYPFDESKRKALKEELRKVNKVIDKLDTDLAVTLRKSLEGYSLHVKKSTHSIFEDFIFPIPIPGLSD